VDDYGCAVKVIGTQFKALDFFGILNEAALMKIVRWHSGNADNKGDNTPKL